MTAHPRPATVLAFGLGSLLVPALELLTYRLLNRDPLNPDAPVEETIMTKDPRLERPSWRGRTNVDALTISVIERAEQLGGHQFVVTQGSYQPPGGGDTNSKGTHDGGGVVDLRWCGHVDCLRNLRQAGAFAWLRTPSQGPWPHHIHLGVVGHPLLAPLAKVQETAYLRGFNGLGANGTGGADDGPRIVPPPTPIWPWPPAATKDQRKEARSKLERVARWMEKRNVPGSRLVRKAKTKTHRKATP